MSKKLTFFYLISFLSISLALSPRALAQQTLGGITGTISDDSGAVIPGATVKVVGDQTNLTRTMDTSDTGAYSIVNLPIGNYTITFTHTGFVTLTVPSIQVQANRTATVNGTLKVGKSAQRSRWREDPADERR